MSSQQLYPLLQIHNLIQPIITQLLYKRGSTSLYIHVQRLHRISFNYYTKKGMSEDTFLFSPLLLGDTLTEPESSSVSPINLFQTGNPAPAAPPPSASPAGRITTRTSVTCAWSGGSERSIWRVGVSQTTARPSFEAERRWVESEVREREVMGPLESSPAKKKNNKNQKKKPKNVGVSLRIIWICLCTYVCAPLKICIDRSSAPVDDPSRTDSIESFTFEVEADEVVDEAETVL
jgi:hypothetical protein